MSIGVELVRRDDLTPREGAAFVLLCKGYCNKAIAAELAISVETVRDHLDRIYLKLDVREARLNARCAAISKAVARGMVRLSMTVLCAVLVVQVVSIDSVKAMRPAAAKVRLRRDY